MWKPLLFSSKFCACTLCPTKTGEAVSALYPAQDRWHLVRVLGKLAMRGRKAFQLNEYMFSYNLYQMVLNAYCAFSILGEARSLGMRVWGTSRRVASCQSPRFSRVVTLPEQVHRAR